MKNEHEVTDVDQTLVARVVARGDVMRGQRHKVAFTRSAIYPEIGVER